MLFCVLFSRILIAKSFFPSLEASWQAAKFSSKLLLLLISLRISCKPIGSFWRFIFKNEYIKYVSSIIKAYSVFFFALSIKLCISFIPWLTLPSIPIVDRAQLYLFGMLPISECKIPKLFIFRIKSGWICWFLVSNLYALLIS